MQQCIYYFMLSVSVLDQVLNKFRLKGVFKDSVPGGFLGRCFWGQFLFNFVDVEDPSGLSLRALGTPGDTQN